MNLLVNIFWDGIKPRAGHAFISMGFWIKAAGGGVELINLVKRKVHNAYPSIAFVFANKL